MKYWPLSIIATSPLVPEVYLPEVSRMHMQGPSQGGYLACVDVARRTAPVEAPSLTVVETLEAPPRLLFIEYPSFIEWARLERVCFCEGDDGVIFGFINPLH